MRWHKGLKGDKCLQAGLAACLILVCCLGLWGAGNLRRYRRYPPESRAGSLPVLCYHCIGEAPGTAYDSLYVSPETFRWQLRWLKEEGYRFLTPEEAWAWQQSAEEGNTVDKGVLLTSDDGYRDNYTEALPILQEEGAKATLFMVAGRIGDPGRLTEEQLREMTDSGVFTLGSHGYWHKDMTGLASEELEEELILSRQRLEEATGVSVEAVAYPLGAYDAAVAATAGRVFSLGFRADGNPLKQEIPPELAPLVIPREGVFGYMDQKDFQFFMGQYFSR